MKKRALFISTLTLVLAACSPSGGSSSASPSSSNPTPSSSDSPSSSSSPSGANIFIEAGWPENEANILYSLLGDHVFPHYDYEKAGYAYTFETYQEAYAMTSVAIIIEDFPVAEQDNIIATLTNGTGYEDKSEEHSAVDGYHIVERVFSDYSYVTSSFSVTDENDNILTEGRGTFEFDIHPARIAKSEWLGTQMEGYVADLFEFAISLPTPSSPASRYITNIYLRDGVIVPTLFFSGIDAVDSYGNDLIAQGWQKVDVLVHDPEDSVYYLSPDEKIAIVAYLANVGEPTVTALEFKVADYFVTYPDSVVNSCLDALMKTTEHVALPKPEVTGTTYFYVNNLVASTSMFTIVLGGVNYVSGYEAQLRSSSSFQIVDYTDRSFVYSDPTGTLAIIVFYTAAHNMTTISVDLNDGRYAGWPKEEADRLIAALGGETLLPADNEASYSYVIDSTNEGYFDITTRNLDENLAYIDTSYRYKALLNDASSGWAYDPYEDKWHDVKNKLAVTLLYDQNQGLVIEVNSYIPSSETLSEETLSSAFSKIGISGYTFESVDGARGYSLIENDGYFSVIAWGVDETKLNAYVQKLTAKGHSSQYVLSYDHYWDSGRKVGFTIVPNETHDRITIDLYPYESMYSYSPTNLQALISRIQTEIDSDFLFPSLPVADDVMGIMRQRSDGRSVFGLYIFTTGFESDLEKLLEDLGYKENESPYGEGHSHSRRGPNTNTLWTIQILVNEDNGYTYINISSV